MSVSPNDHPMNGEALLRQILDTSSVAIFLVDRDGRINQANQRMAEMFGWSLETLIGNEYVALVHPSEREIGRQKMVALLASDIPSVDLERRYWRADHTEFWGHLTGKRFYDGYGKESGLVGVIADITERKRLDAARLRSETKFRTLYESTGEAVMLLDANGFFDCNKAALALYGCATLEEFCACHPADLSPPTQPCGTDSMVLANRHIATAMEKGSSTRFEWIHKRADTGENFTAEVLLNALTLDHHLVVQATVRDISAQKRAEQNLRIAAIAFDSQEGMFISDAARVIVRVNRAFTEITGYTADDAVGQTPRLLHSGRHDDAFYAETTERIQHGGSWQGEVWSRRKNGEIYPEWRTITAVKDGAGVVVNYVTTLVDIAVRKESEDKIKNLAFYDPLTGLPNRRLLLDRLEHALAASLRYQNIGALLFIDLDNFKILNDTVGHYQGDMLLQQVAQRLLACIRESDTVARLGGDEFVVILGNLSGNWHDASVQAKAVGTKIQDTLRRPYEIAHHEHYNTPSIGVTLFPHDGEGIDDVLKQADLALYEAKAAGPDSMRFFDPAMQTALAQRSALENGLRLAVECGQLCLYYQPQIDGDRRVIGAEALLRWIHPERGLVPPGDFIPLAEETGLILPIGSWVLETACKQIKQWSTEPATRDLRLAVNVSARQFRQPDFAAQVTQTLMKTGADPTRLKIELTESVVIDNVADTIARMQALKSLGVQFSMDDFGTGYSSLSYLKRLPLDQLKIDRSFVRDLASDSNDAAIVQTIITMGKTLGLDVIAEGVESEEQLERLREYGCVAYQGFLFSQPLPLLAFEAFIQRD